ncbi:putative btb poz domain containing protein [Botrytis fragariae]|uniref:Putative btb poz domain containing protein n=1 Tax=Botrytis fragariae TaxID=1964551 RepID=A0A8H6ELH7_9HELO|nr:putative btb poz domain containing protein [Botrytis fragariae]KAF5876315.1 putative btb poz domain containing protein [Botrytis fragariae]
MAGRLDELGDELVHIFVGPERKKFSVHKNLIRRSGDFFKAAFQDNGFKEGAENKMDLPEDKPYIFQKFVTWMYTAQVGSHQDQTEEAGDDCNLAIIELYIFADKYQSVQLMDFAMDSLQNSLKNNCSGLSFREVEMVFEFTKSRFNQPLRRFAISIMACTVLDGTLCSSLQEMERIFKEIDGALIETLKCIPLLLLTHSGPKYRTDDSTCDEGFGICKFHQHKLDAICNSPPNKPVGLV